MLRCIREAGKGVVPLVIFTDADAAMISACSTDMPETQHFRSGTISMKWDSDGDTVLHKP